MMIDATSLIKSVTRISGENPKSLKTALKVNRLVIGSSADLAGVTEGDYLLCLNDAPANAVDYRQMAVRSIEVKYTFYKPHEKQYLEILAKSAPLGVSYIKTNETIYYEYTNDIERANYNDLFPVWNERNWKTLKKISDKAFIPLIMWMNCLAKNIEYCPEYLFNGAALYDSGNYKKGMARIKCFDNVYSYTYSQEEESIVKYYYAKEMLRKNQREAGIELMQNAYMQGRHERIANEIFKLTGKKPNHADHWPDRIFPHDYNLKQVIYGNSKWVKLSTALKAMGNNQFLFICMLGNYRANGFYNEFMHRFLGYMNCFPDAIFDLHVIIEDPQGTNIEFPELLEYEEHYVKTKGNMNILHDIDEQIWDALEPHGSPTIYALNNKGCVLHEGELLENDLWDIFLKQSNTSSSD